MTFRRETSQLWDGHLRPSVVRLSFRQSTVNAKILESSRNARLSRLAFSFSREGTNSIEMPESATLGLQFRQTLQKCNPSLAGGCPV